MYHRDVPGPSPAAPSGRSRQPMCAIARFRRDRRGAVSMMFGIMTMALFMMIGLAVDTGRWLNAHDQTVSAIDAAVLAAGRALQTDNTDTNTALAIARTYYSEAIKSRIATLTDTVGFSITDNGLGVTATGNATLATPFMALGGVRQLPLLRNAATEYSKAKIAVGGNAKYSVETALMLDVSGSMDGTKLEDLKTAATDLVNIIVWADQSSYTSKVALVPFSSDVRPPPSMSGVLGDKATFTRVSTNRRGGTTTYYFAPTGSSSPCAAERGGSDRYTDAAPTGSNKLTWVHHRVSQASTTTTSCDIHSDAVIVPLSNSKTTLTTAITDMVAQGGTSGHLGTAWTYYVLSPNWAAVLPVDSQPAAYGNAQTKKIAVLMTDGEYNFTFHPDKGPSSDSGATGGAGASINGVSSAEQAKVICTNMKASGIEIYTVGFQLPNDTARETMNFCATDPSHAFTAADGEELKRAFREIALQISTLFLSQ